MKDTPKRTAAAGKGGSVNEAENMVGRKLGDYTLERKLAVGGMAHIYLGRDAKLERMAAIKILSRDMLNDSVMAQRFEREARAIAKLEHESIIPIYQFGEQDGQYFLAMRYVEGRDLAQEVNDLRQKGKLMDVRRALTILEKVASALDYAHRNNIIHRDIKPSNVLLGANDKVYLSDFGLAMLSSDKTLGTAFGTPRYISPEQATDSLKTVPQSDIYSLAVMVYEILTGALLFDAPHPLEVALAHVTQQPKPPRAHNPAIPAVAQEEILKALSKDPNKRHQTAMEFIQALKTAYESAFKDNSSTIPFAPDDFESPPEQVDAPTNSTRSTPSLRPSGMLQELSPRDTQAFRDRTGTQPLRPKPNTLANKSLLRNQSQPRSNEMMLLYVLAGAAVTIMVVVLIVLVVPQNPTNLPTPVILDSDLTNTSVALGMLVETANAATLTAGTTLTAPTAEGGTSIALAVTDEAVSTEESAVTQEIEETEAVEATSTDTETPTDTPTVTPSATITETPRVSPTDEPPTDEPPTDQPPTDEPTITPTTGQRGATLTPSPAPTKVGVVAGESDQMIMRYNDQFLALINTGDKSVAIQELTMRGLSGVDEDNFSNSGRSLGLTLNPGECVVIRSGRATGQVPSDWNCTKLLETTVNKNTLFWRADAGTPSEDTQFVVQAAGEDVATCDTAGRAVGRVGTLTCDILWPLVTTNPEPTAQG